MTRASKVPLLLALLPGLLCAAGEFDFAIDIPTLIAGTTYYPNQTVTGYAPGAVYGYAPSAGPGAGIPAGVRIDALTRRESDGLWLLSIDAPAVIAGTAYHPADVIGWNGAAYAKLHDRLTALFLPPDADISGLGWRDGKLLLSFDARTLLPLPPGGNFPADPRTVYRVTLLAPVPDYAPDFDGASIGLPPGSRLTGFEPHGASGMRITVDVPFQSTSLQNYQPGDILRWTPAGGDALEYRDTSVFPHQPSPPNLMADFAAPLSPGEAAGVTIAKSGPDLSIAWSAPAGCAAPVSVPRAYAIYEGTLGTWYSHDAALGCDHETGPQLVTPGAGSRYYLVVPNNGAFEGAYGAGATGPIPPSAAACRPEPRPVACN